MKLNPATLQAILVTLVVVFVAAVMIGGALLDGRNSARFANDMHAKGFVEIQYQGRQIWVKADQVQQFLAATAEKP